MKFNLTIDIKMDNDAFRENPGELDEILRLYVNNNFFPHGAFSVRSPLKDSNGNTVGYAAAEVTE